MVKAVQIEKIRQFSVQELQDDVLETSKKQFEARIMNATGRLKDPSELRRLRRHLARLKTVANERELHND